MKFSLDNFYGYVKKPKGLEVKRLDKKKTEPASPIRIYTEPFLMISDKTSSLEITESCFLGRNTMSFMCAKRKIKFVFADPFLKTNTEIVQVVPVNLCKNSIRKAA